MRAELKGIHSPGIVDIENYEPSNPYKFSFLLQVMIGPAGKEGEESFDIEVCTPLWIEETYNYNDIIVGRHHLIVMEYNYYELIKFITNYINQCTGADWKEIAEKIGRFAKWEFEDYVE